MKKCAICKLTFELDKFYFHKTTGNAYSKCKRCCSMIGGHNQAIRRKVKWSHAWFYNRFLKSKRNARLRGIEHHLLFEEFKAILTSTKKCFYCEEKPERVSLDRVVNTFGYTRENTVMACLKCNFLKRGLLSSDKQRMLDILSKL